MAEAPSFREVVVGLDAAEAALIVHLLATFERLLRQGSLDDRQLRFLVPPGSGSPAPAGDVETANNVAEAIELLERQR
jgi:hypothetical protein